MVFKADKYLKPALRDNKRASVHMTFETFTRVLGFNHEVALRAATIDHARGMLSFYFAGDGLVEIETEQEIDLRSFEGQEAPCIEPPAYRNMVGDNRDEV